MKRLPDDEKVFVSQDINPLMKARRHGLRVYRVDARWLPEPLPSPDATEIAQLKQKLELYQRSEPEFEAQLSIEPATVKLFRVRQLEQTDRSHLESRILSRNPRKSQDHLGLTGLFFDHTFDSRYSRYVEKAVPEFCDDFHKLLEIQFNQVVYKIRLKNAGQVRADHLSVKMRIVGGFFNSKPIAMQVLGPRAPVPMRTIDQLHNTHNYLSAINGNAARVGRHDIDITLDDQSDVFTAECENFKSGQTWQRDGVVWLDPRAERQHLLLLEATAANFHGTFTKVLKFDVAIEDCDAFDLVNRESGDFVREPYVKPLIASAIAAERYSDFEWAPGSK